MANKKRKVPTPRHKAASPAAANLAALTPDVRRAVKALAKGDRRIEVISETEAIIRNGKQPDDEVIRY